jgi:hypothetical protein
MTARGKKCWRGISPTSWLFPAAYEDIDWARGYESLDKELQQIVRDAALGTRLADKLMKVWRRNGDEQIVLIHTEIQRNRDEDFPKRMYIYNYRLFDRYDRPVVSLAVWRFWETRAQHGSHVAITIACGVVTLASSSRLSSCATIKNAGQNERRTTTRLPPS